MPNEDFARQVQAAFATLLDSGRLTIVREVGSGSFDNALVDLEAPPLRLRLIRERGRLSVLLGSVDHPDKLYDWTFVAKHLDGLSDEYVSRGAEIDMVSFALLLNAWLDEIRSLFSNARYESVTRELDRQKREHSIAAFDWKAPEDKP